jgi:large repetitive protein
MHLRIWLLGIAVLAGCGSVKKTADDAGDDGTDDGASSDDADDGPEPGYYRLYVDVNGLSGTLVLQNGGGDDLIVTEDGTHRFATDLLDGTQYEVTVMSDPEVQNCHVAAATGAIDSADVQLAVGCYGNILMWIDDNPDGNLYNHELWMSDGTTDGTGRSVNINQDETVGTGPSDMTRFLGMNYLAANDGTGTALWRTDGTQANTAEVRDFANLTLGRYSLHHEGSIYFAADGDAAGNELWRFDGTLLERLTDINPGSGGGLNYPSYAVVGNRLVFPANDGALGDNPWSYDLGTGTAQLLRDTFPGAFAGQVSNVTALGDRAVFVAYDQDLGFGVWVTDGTPGGTTLIHDMNPAGDGGLMIFLATDGETAYFQGNDGTSGAELWKTDGTTAGTIQVRDINSGSGSSDPGSMVAYAGEKWFVATDTGGTELWHTDGTEAGTQKLEVNPSESIGSDPHNLKVAGDRLYFIADGGDGAGPEVWATDGTTRGTVRITDAAPGPDAGAGQLGPWDGRVMYFFDASYETTTLWSTDGTPEGTQKVKDICAEPACQPYAQFVEISE